MIQLEKDAVLSLLPDRNPDTHKGDYGKILLLCGSRGYTGAAALSAMAALRCGAGLVYMGVPESIYAIEAMKLTEPVIFPLADENGMLSQKALEQIRGFLSKMNAILIGPGLGQSEGTLAVLRYVLKSFCGPVVVDADGINLLARHKDLVRERTYPTILTPHDGEFRRLGGMIGEDRAESAKCLARDLHAIVVMKGHRTIITDGKETFINSTGNPGMAVGGSGDVLAGMIVSLLGQKIRPIDAAACAVWLHGSAGDICAKHIGQYGMLPSDMIRVLPRLLK